MNHTFYRCPLCKKWVVWLIVKNERVFCGFWKTRKAAEEIFQTCINTLHRLRKKAGEV